MAEEPDRGGEGATVTTGSDEAPAEDDEDATGGGEQAAASVLSLLLTTPLEAEAAAGAACASVVDIVSTLREKNASLAGWDPSWNERNGNEHLVSVDAASRKLLCTAEESLSAPSNSVCPDFQARLHFRRDTDLRYHSFLVQNIEEEKLDEA